MASIPLTKGAVAVVDDADFEALSVHKWHLSSSGYAARNVCKRGARSYVLMHRQILGDNAGPHTDHVNGDPLDNRRVNLRPCTASQNQGNRKKKSVGNPASVFKGVWWNRSCGKWQAGLSQGDRDIHLGVFTSEIDAALAYDLAAVEVFGEFARTNFPPGSLFPRETADAA